MNLGLILGTSSAIIGGTTAVITAFEAKRSISRWSFSAGLALFSAQALFWGLATDERLPENVVSWETCALWVNALSPAIWLIFSLTYGRAEQAKTLRRYRFALSAAFLFPIALLLAFHNELIFAVSPVVGNGGWLLRLTPAALVLHLGSLVAAILVLMNLEATFRASVGTMRWRIKFMVLGLAIVFIARAYSSSQVLLFRSPDFALQALNSAALLLGCFLMVRTLLRPGHFEVTIYPAPIILYNSLTILLAGVYFIIVGGLAKIVAYLGGGSSFELKALVVLVVVVTLGVVACSDHVRVHTKRFIGRYLERPSHDYQMVWRVFTKATARQVELPGLCNAVVKLVSDVFDCLSVALWIVDDRGQEELNLVATTFALNTEMTRLRPSRCSELVAALKSHPGPVDVDMCREPWAAGLREIHPDKFRKGGHRICVPLVAGGELLGILMLGDRVGGMAFSVQDLDLLKSVSDQTAACVLNIQLSQKVSQAKQLEAFQAMSAFFVHDLKNTASTLSLMLQNLPIHYQDPQFREDALRGISKTVEHINDLISRLTVLRHDLQVKAVRCDLNELIAQTLKVQGQIPGVELVKKLQPTPKVCVDPPQIQKVVTNLVLNAREALPNGGTIRVETGQRNGWAELSVADNGCGMTPEFVSRSLFRPFNTTKKKGIGIGMFHCKMIVEAHKGRIEVESEVGKGTAFRVLLPATPSA